MAKTTGSKYFHRESRVLFLKEVNFGPFKFCNSIFAQMLADETVSVCRNPYPVVVSSLILLFDGHVYRNIPQALLPFVAEFLDGFPA